jgi:hypothetical protein
MTQPKLTPAQRKLIDEYAETRAKVAAWKPAVNPHAARLAALVVEITKLTDREPADEEVLLAGYHFSVPVGMKRIKRTIVRLKQLFRRLGSEWVEEHCQPNLGDLDKALAPEERSEFVEESRELSRIIGVPLAAQPKTKAA